MVEGVEILAHDKSLSPLLQDLSVGQWLQKECDDDDVEDGVVSPGLKNTSSSDVGEVVVSDEDQVSGCVSDGCDGGGGEDSLGVVHAVHDGLVLLPLVIIHIY